VLGLHAVDLVATLRAMLVQPQLAAHRIERRTLRIAVSEAVDLGQRAGAADEGVVGRHLAVGLDAHRRAHRGGKQHHCDDVARAHASSSAYDEQIAATALRDVHDPGARLCVQPARVADGELPGLHRT